MIRKENKTSLRTHGAAGSRIGSRLRSRAAGAAAALMSLVAVLCTGCAKDPTEQPRGPHAGDADYALLQLLVPGAAANTRAAAPEEEQKIDLAQTHILFSNKSNDKWYFSHVMSGGNGTAPGDLTFTPVTNDKGAVIAYSVKVPFKTGTQGSKFRLGVITGITRAELEKAGGSDWSNFNQQDYPDPADENGKTITDPLHLARILCTVKTEEKWSAGRALPMWGQSEEFTQVPNASLGTISLARAMARVDVGVKFIKNGENGNKYNLDAMQAEGLYDGGKGTPFYLTSVQVVRTMKGGSYGPGSKADKACPVPGIANERFDLGKLEYQVGDFTEGKVPDHIKEQDIIDFETAARKCLTRACYVFETPNAGAEFDAAACVIVGGVYGENNTNTTYYRIDFATTKDQNGVQNGVQNKPQPDERFDLLRNTVYVVNITSVSGPGAKDPEEALTSDDTKMTAEIQAWKQDDKVGDITTDGVYTLSVDKSELQYYSDGTPEEIVVKTDYNGELGLGSGWVLEAYAQIPEDTPDKTWTEEEKEAEHEKFRAGLQYYDSKGNPHDFSSGNFPKMGRNGTTTLRIGMKELLDEGGKTAYLNGKLLIKAGRMQAQILIRQSSQERLRILFDPEEMVFGKGDPDATKNDAFTQAVKISVTTRKPNLVLTVSGTDNKGAKYARIIRHPDAAMVGTNPNPGGGAAADDRFDIFFDREDPTVGGDSTGFLLLPKYFDGDRSFTIDVTASLDGRDDVAPAKERLMVYQLKDVMRWKVMDGGLAYDLRSNPWQVIFDQNEHSNTKLNIEITPESHASRPWWFSKGDDITELPDWLSNIEIGKNLAGQHQTPGVRPHLTRHDGIGRRSVTLKVEEMSGGLPSSDSKLVITQRGKPLELKPILTYTSNTAPDPLAQSPGDAYKIHETQPVDLKKGTKGIYTLDHGATHEAATYSFTMEANTNWIWFWNRENQTLHDENMRLLVENDTWKGTPTSDKMQEDGLTETWPVDVATFTVPKVDAVNFDEPADKETPNPDIELGGRRTVVLELRNHSPQLATEDVEEWARELRITRDLPAYTHIVRWPFDQTYHPDVPGATPTLTNLDNKIHDGAPEPYDESKFELLTNAGVKFELYEGDPKEDDDAQEFLKKSPEENGYWRLGQQEWFSTNGYDKEDFALDKMSGMPTLTKQSQYGRARFFCLKAEWQQYNKGENKNETKTAYQYAYSGFQPKMPARNMDPAQRFLSAEAHDGTGINGALKFDFSNSYFREMKVRVKVSSHYTDYKTAGSHQDYEEFYLPAYDAGKDEGGEKGIVLSTVAGKARTTLEVKLPANTKNPNLIRRVEVEFYDANAGRWYTNDEISPSIWQDGTGTDYNGTNYLVYYDTKPIDLSAKPAWGPNSKPSNGSYNDVKAADHVLGPNIWEYVHNLTNANATEMLTICEKAWTNNTSIIKATDITTMPVKLTLKPHTDQYNCVKGTLKSNGTTRSAQPSGSGAALHLKNCQGRHDQPSTWPAMNLNFETSGSAPSNGHFFSGSSIYTYCICGAARDQVGFYIGNITGMAPNLTYTYFYTKIWFANLRYDNAKFDTRGRELYTVRPALGNDANTTTELHRQE